jgi:predicted TIM-barrel fold metal-dependent hydrolase
MMASFAVQAQSRSADRVQPNPSYKQFGYTDEQIEALYGEIIAARLRNAKSAGSSDPAVRLADMDYDGVALDVIYHGTPRPSGVIEPIPFATRSKVSADEQSSAKGRELEVAGNMIYNRWLADFCASAPGRHGGICQIPIWDLDRAAEIVNWAADHGLVGVNFPSPQASLPPYEDPMWDRFFAVCAERNMPLCTHLGSFMPPYYSGPGAGAILTEEVEGAAGRNMWHLIFSGAFDRHPALKLVITEVAGRWFIDASNKMDAVFDAPTFAGPILRSFLKKRPSEYIRSNVYFGVSMMSRTEAELVIEHGLVDRVMYGTDYPHPEGTWLYFDEGDESRRSVTRLAIASTFHDLDEADVRKMLGLNAIACYGLDGDTLRDVASRIGPRLDEVRTAPDLSRIPPEYTGCGFRSSFYLEEMYRAPA